MRTDAIGMFWEDLPPERGRGNTLRPMPPIPETGWKPPKEYPNLNGITALAIDTETFDPDLKTHGPGWARGRGHIVGVSIGTLDGNRWYFPIRHEIDPHDNMSPENTLEFLRDTLNTEHCTKIGANLYYDIGWLRHEGVITRGPLVDVQFAEALLNENDALNLDTLGERYLGIGKSSNLLYQWCSDYYGGEPTGDQRKNIYRAPPSLVGPYAEGDVDLPIKIAEKQYQLMHKEGLLDIFSLECRLIPLLVDMRYAGIKVDIDKTEHLSAEIIKRIEHCQKRIDNTLGFHVEITVPTSLAKACDALGIKYGVTPKSGIPSFTKNFLETLNHPVIEDIREIRRLEKLKGTFLESYILNSHINGRLHGQFHTLRGDDGGTRSGRLASSTPNLQNIPIRDPELGKLIRSLFIPDDGHTTWRKFDESQVEYRFLIHYAIGPGADEARRKFIADPKTDYHEMALDLVAPEAGWDISTKELRKERRRPVKNINFGLIYGMGVDKLSHDLGLTTQQGKALFAAYHRGVPFARETMKACIDTARNTGIITTILGRKSRFDFWVPARFNKETIIPLRYKEAYAAWGGNIERAYVHKALNRRLQGSAADLLKKAMVECYEDGLFDVTGIPKLTVHDELDFSDPGTPEAHEAFKEVKRVMETAIPLSIPLKVDEERGPNWGDLKDAN